MSQKHQPVPQTDPEASPGFTEMEEGEEDNDPVAHNSATLEQPRPVGNNRRQDKR